MSHLLRMVLVVCMVVLGIASTASTAQAAGLDEQNDALEALRARLARLVVEASKDPREHALDRYAAMDLEALKARRRKDVNVKQIFTWLYDAERPMATALRERAVDVVLARRLYDPDLVGGRRGRRTKLARWCMDLVQHLAAKDLESRQLTHRLLSGLWTWGSSAAVPFRGPGAAYNPKQKSTWAPAMKAWQRFLRNK